MGNRDATLAQDALYFKKGVEAQETSDWKAAILSFKKAVAIDGNNPSYLYHLGA